MHRMSRKDVVMSIVILEPAISYSYKENVYTNNKIYAMIIFSLFVKEYLMIMF